VDECVVVAAEDVDYSPLINCFFAHCGLGPPSLRLAGLGGALGSAVATWRNGCSGLTAGLVGAKVMFASSSLSTR
jgi:hypothetical protein